MPGDVPHEIIHRPHEYQIVSLRYEVEGVEGEAYLDLHLAKGAHRRRLRFWSPRGLEIEEGFPAATSGLQILDVSDRRMEGLGVRVSDFEASWGAIRFWAREVVDLDVETAP